MKFGFISYGVYCAMMHGIGFRFCQLDGGIFKKELKINPKLIFALMITLGILSVSFLSLYNDSNIEFKTRELLFTVGYVIPFFTIFLILLLPKSKKVSS